MEIIANTHFHQRHSSTVKKFSDFLFLSLAFVFTLFSFEMLCIFALPLTSIYYISFFFLLLSNAKIHLATNFLSSRQNHKYLSSFVRICLRSMEKLFIFSVEKNKKVVRPIRNLSKSFVFLRFASFRNVYLQKFQILVAIFVVRCRKVVGHLEPNGWWRWRKWLGTHSFHYDD